MRKLLILLETLMVIGSGCSTSKSPFLNSDTHKKFDNFILVKGGTFIDTNSTNYYGKGVIVSSFYIGKYEVTQKEWMEVMGSNPSKFQGDNLPVEMVSWYDCVEYCNKRSIKEGLKPYYNIDKNKKDPDNVPDPDNGDLDNIKWTVTLNTGANGYRLPTEVEWEYAADGGRLSKSYLYSGGNDVDRVAWYWKNSGDTNLTGFWLWPAIEQNHDRTHTVGSKKSNELGLYDMSGNVREWCWDWYGDLKTNVIDPDGSSSGYARVWKGGGWIGGDFCCEPSYRSGLAANGMGPDQGFRVCRSR
jgi:formylglycine-generating enzyme required for sulfatase activity